MYLLALRKKNYHFHPFSRGEVQLWQLWQWLAGEAALTDAGLRGVIVSTTMKEKLILSADIHWLSPVPGGETLPCLSDSGSHEVQRFNIRASVSASAQSVGFLAAVFAAPGCDYLELCWPGSKGRWSH